ncbi:hypothetical protein JAAARDRAFT_607543 [Jaapia argillacea MUCL 33604]|uniref:BTB domain-containing protein n=1 Tax=Jaapia argillacea MUCL 33604 TaxID=933084 RepID=A0A067QAF3_9AGAM|nr:hypothetical protein JAAARDRAFT_607543 [Jaapia argillacea MUCL 33604]
MTDPRPTSPNSAKPPFNHPRADIILRSSDNVDFATFKSILFLSSPVFEDMFSMPQPPRRAGTQVDKDDIPVVDLSEDSRTLELLLGFCHPGDRPIIETVVEARNLLVAAMKYDIGFIRVASKERLLALEKSEPASLFAFACTHKIRDLAIDAAKLALQIPEPDLLPKNPSILPPEFFSISAGNLMHLLFYHRACVAVTAGIITTDLDLAAQPLPRCTSCGAHPQYVCSFWRDFQSRLLPTLRRRPSGETVMTIGRYLSISCSHCAGSDAIRNDANVCIKKMAVRVDDLINKVPLHLDF